MLDMAPDWVPEVVTERTAATTPSAICPPVEVGGWDVSTVCRAGTAQLVNAAAAKMMTIDLLIIRKRWAICDSVNTKY
jgi:hypothetical protein